MSTLKSLMMNPENFQNQILFQRLEQLESRLDEPEVRKRINLEKYSFFESACKYIIDRLKTTMPILVQESEMKMLETEVTTALQQINAFLGNNNEGHLVNATNNLNSAVSRTRNFPLIFSKGDFNFSKAITDFQKQLIDKYELIQTESNKLKDGIEAVDIGIRNSGIEIEKLHKLIQERELEIKNLNSTFQTNFDNIKSKASQEIENDRNEFRNEIEDDRKDFRREIDELKGNFTTGAAQIIDRLNEKLNEARKIVTSIGDIGVTGNYQIIANEHRSSANRWRLVAIVFMAIFSLVLVWVIIDLSSAGFNWTKSIIRIIAAAALSYPATYAARESSRHRKLETINRTAELELASLGPFIELFSVDKQQAIKEKLVEKYFGNNKMENNISEKNEEELSLSGFDRILKAILPFIKK